MLLFKCIEDSPDMIVSPVQVIAQLERNDAYLMADFLTKRGQHPEVGPTASPSKDFTHGKVSDVLGAFMQTLAVGKVGFISVACSCCPCSVVLVTVCVLHTVCRTLRECDMP